MSSQLENTSAILGEYMLKGWTLTDLHCETCRVTPLMREPAAAASAQGRDRIQFCALCDGRPEGRQSAANTSASTSTNAAVPLPQAPSSSSNTVAASDPSTAPVAPATTTAPDPAESISSLLLTGYSLLAENCPNSTCRGIPLVGYPRKKDGSKDSRRLCVSCGSRWVGEGDLAGMKVVAKSEQESPRSKTRRELYGLEVDKGKAKEEGVQGPELELAPGAEYEINEQDLEDAIAELPAIQAASSIAQRSTTTGPPPVLRSALDRTTSSLANTLEKLASSLDAHTARTGDEARYFVDVKLHTEAIKDVLDVLGAMKKYNSGM